MSCGEFGQKVSAKECTSRQSQWGCTYQMKMAVTHQDTVGRNRSVNLLLIQWLLRSWMAHKFDSLGLPRPEQLTFCFLPKTNAKIAVFSFGQDGTKKNVNICELPPLTSLEVRFYPRSKVISPSTLGMPVRPLYLGPRFTTWRNLAGAPTEGSIADRRLWLRPIFCQPPCDSDRSEVLAQHSVDGIKSAPSQKRRYETHMVSWCWFTQYAPLVHSSLDFSFRAAVLNPNFTNWTHWTPKDRIEIMLFLLGSFLNSSVRVEESLEPKGFRHATWTQAMGLRDADDDGKPKVFLWKYLRKCDLKNPWWWKSWKIPFFFGGQKPEGNPRGLAEVWDDPWILLFCLW